MKYWQSIKSLLGILILIILIPSCQKKKGEVVTGYIESDAKIQVSNFCGGPEELQILVTIESGESVWFRIPKGYWLGSELLSQRPTRGRIYIEGRYFKGFLENCSHYIIAFAYLKE